MNHSKVVIQNLIEKSLWSFEAVLRYFLCYGPHCALVSYHWLKYHDIGDCICIKFWYNLSRTRNIY